MKGRGEWVLNFVNLNPGILLQPDLVLRSVDIAQDKQVIKINQVPFFLGTVGILMQIWTAGGSHPSTVTADKKYLLSEKQHQYRVRQSSPSCNRGTSAWTASYSQTCGTGGVHQELLRTSDGNHIAKMLHLDSTLVRTRLLPLPE